MPSIQSSAPGHVPNARIKTVVQEVLAEQPPGGHTHTIADVTGLASALADKASLVEGKVPASQLPSYVDDVLEFASFAAFPAVGESGKIYIDTATNEQYRWSGSAYISIVASPGSSDEVAEGATNKYYTDARAALKADVAHTHSIAHVAGLQTELDGKSAAGHGHAISDVAELQDALDGKAADSHSHSWSNITDKPTTFTPATHGHEISDVTGLQTALDGKSVAGHTHAIADVTGLQTALDGKSATGHGHEISDVTGLQIALDAKEVKEGFFTAPNQNINFGSGRKQKITTSSNLALTFTGGSDGDNFILEITASGADRTITFPAGVWAAFGAPSFVIPSGRSVAITGYRVGTIYKFFPSPDAMVI